MLSDLILHLPMMPLAIIEGLTTAGYIALYASLAASAAGAVLSSNAQRQQAKQTELNAEAQGEAIAMEQKRKAAETAENMRRLSVQERRERASQFSALASSGVVATTGTPLSIMADTLTAQQQRRGDLSTQGSLTDWQLRTKRGTLLQEAQSSASNLRSQAGASLVSGLASTGMSGVSIAT